MVRLPVCHADVDSDDEVRERYRDMYSTFVISNIKGSLSGTRVYSGDSLKIYQSKTRGVDGQSHKTRFTSPGWK